jgi:MYXO-CTERM domain-containing protein
VYLRTRQLVAVVGLVVMVLVAVAWPGVVAAQNQPPTVPVPINPSERTGANTTTPVFSWMPSTDPEGDPITYGLTVRDAAGSVFGEVSGVSGTITSLASELENWETYTWVVRATDRAGATSGDSPPTTFRVFVPEDDDWECPEATAGLSCLPPEGCAGCTTGPRSAAGWWLGALAVAGLVVRRRRLQPAR